MERAVLSVAEVLEITPFSEDTIRRACRSGELEYSKMRGRIVIKPAALMKWIDDHAKKATTRQRR